MLEKIWLKIKKHKIEYYEKTFSYYKKLMTEGGIRYVFHFLKAKYRKTYKHEIRKSFGKKFPDKTFYIIGVDEGWCGLFAIMTHQLTHIAYAVEQGYIPIIMKF